jgi:hypothetical protein
LDTYYLPEGDSPTTDSPVTGEEREQWAPLQLGLREDVNRVE